MDKGLGTLYCSLLRHGKGVSVAINNVASMVESYWAQGETPAMNHSLAHFELCQDRLPLHLSSTQLNNIQEELQLF